MEGLRRRAAGAGRRIPESARRRPRPRRTARPDAQARGARSSRPRRRSGYPAAAYCGGRTSERRTRPKRLDTTVVLEANGRGPRGGATAPDGGLSRIAAAAVSSRAIRVPETFLRERPAADGRSTGCLIAVKIVARRRARRHRRSSCSFGSFASAGVPMELGRSPPPRRRRRARGGCRSPTGYPTVFRRYPTEMPLRLFSRRGRGESRDPVARGGARVRGVGFRLHRGARPGWRSALRQRGIARRRALPRGRSRRRASPGSRTSARRCAATRYPALFEPDPSLPGPLATTRARVRRVLVRLARQLGDRGVVAAVAGARAAPGLLPDSDRPRSRRRRLASRDPAIRHLSRPGEFAAAYLPDVATLAWLAFCGLVLLARPCRGLGLLRRARVRRSGGRRSAVARRGPGPRRGMGRGGAARRRGRGRSWPARREAAVVPRAGSPSRPHRLRRLRS